MRITITVAVDFNPHDARLALYALADFVLGQCGDANAREMANALYDAQIHRAPDAANNPDAAKEAG